MTAGTDLSMKSEKDIKVTGDLTATAGNVKTESTGDTAISGNVKAGQNVTTNSTGDTKISGNVTATSDISVTGQNITHDKGTMSGANVTLDGNKAVDLTGDGITAKADAILKAGTSLNMAETITAGKDVSMNAGTTLDVSGAVTATAGNITTESKENTTISGNLTAGQKITTNSTGDTTIGADMTAETDISVTAKNLVQEKGKVSGTNVTVNALEDVALSGGSIDGRKTDISAGTDLTQAKAHTLKTSNLSAASTGELALSGTNNQITNAVLDSKRSTDGNAVVFHNGVGDSKVTVTNSIDSDAKVMGDILAENSSEGIFNVYNLHANNITVKGNGDVTLGLWTENADMYADGDLKVNGKSIINLSKNMGVAGDITMSSTDGNMINRALILSTGGDVTLAANEGRVINISEADIVTLGGNITLIARASDTEKMADVRNGSVYNQGNLLAYTEEDHSGKGNVHLVSETADVYNYDDFNELSYQVGDTSYSISVNDIEMSAANGVLFTGQEDLHAGGKITLTAKEGLCSVGTNIIADGDISITATDGSIYNRADIDSTDGNVTIKAEKGSVVNTLTGNILAGGGNAELIAGGATEENRPFYMASAEGDAKVVTPSVDGSAISVVKAYKYYKSDKTGAYERITDETNIDAMSKDELLSIVTTASYVDADGEDQDLSFTGDGVENVTITVWDSETTKTLSAIKGDMEFIRAGDVLNRGDVVAMGQTEQKGDEIHSVVPGTITLRSEHGDVINYDNYYKVDGEDYEKLGERKYMLSTGNIGLEAPEGNFYNDFSFRTAGDLTLSSKGDMAVGKDFTIADVGGDINITSSEGKIFNGDGSTLVAGKDLNLSAKKGVDNYGSLVGGNNVSIESETGDINSTDAHALNGAVDIVTKYGNVNVAEVSGDRVSITAGGEEHEISVGDVEVGSYLKLHGDYINTDVEVKHGDSYKGVIHFDIAGGVENSMVKGDINLKNAGDSVFDTLHVTDATIDITENGKFDSDRIRIHGNADISAMGSKTAIFGTKPRETDANYKYADTGTWMSLHTYDAHHQASNGVLMHHDGKYYSDSQRYSEENLARQYTDYKISVDRYRYITSPIVIFDRYNILENALPSVSYTEDDEEFSIV